MRILLLALLFTPRLLAAQIEHVRPDDVARALLHADSIHDWRAVLRLAHPDAIAEFKRDQLSSIRGDWMGSGVMDAIPACLQDRMRRTHRMLLDSVYLVPSADALTALPADTVFARHQRWISSLRDSVSSRMDSLMPRPRRSYAGHVMANDTTAYGVLVEIYDRVPIEGWPRERAQIMTFRRFGSGWRSMLDPDFGSSGGVSMMIDDGC